MLYKDIDQIVSTTHDTVNKLLNNYKNGDSALALYFRYIQQRKMQENNVTHSNDVFMQKAMWRWKDKFYSAKKILLENKIIENVPKKDDKGKIEWWYIKVNFVVTTSTLLETQSVDSPLGGEPATNTLVIKLNTLVEKENNIHDSSKKTNALPKGSYNASPSEKEKMFNEFRSNYPNKKWIARARVIRSKITDTPYESIIYACKVFAQECKGKDQQYIKQWDTWLSQQCREDYPTMTRDELRQDMFNTRHRDVENRKDTAYGQWYKSKYEAILWKDWYDSWMEDKTEIKTYYDKLRKEHRLFNNGQDLPCP